MKPIQHNLPGVYPAQYRVEFKGDHEKSSVYLPYDWERLRWGGHYRIFQNECDAVAYMNEAKNALKTFVFRIVEVNM